ncbi:hypothetical protein CH92_18165 [Stutzerimonas stutzeri]|uniref:Uncharacterized protein n=1 Tax=Stutzerimonas stutzeri TaxID=316 RepID=W8R428_STUST|nr:hypothetical protein CH92_18165 [Stutzerimonas stutzeri]
MRHWGLLGAFEKQAAAAPAAGGIIDTPPVNENLSHLRDFYIQECMLQEPLLRGYPGTAMGTDDNAASVEPGRRLDDEQRRESVLA